MTATLTFAHLFSFGPLTIPAIFRDVYAVADGGWTEDEYHRVESGHWANGRMPGTGSLELDEDSVEAWEADLYFPVIERLVGPHLSASIHAWINERFQGRILRFVTVLLRDEPYELGWED